MPEPIPEPVPESLCIRPVRAEDHSQLRALLRRVAVITPKESYRLEREPDAFALQAYQGTHSQIYVASEDSRILGMVAVAIDRVWIDGEVREVAYSSEMRVLPEARGRKLGEMLQLASLDASCKADGERVPLFNTVMRSNPVGMRMNRYLAEAGREPVIELTDVMTYFWPSVIAPLLGRLPGQFRLATADDYPAMAALWQELARSRQLARAYRSEEWGAPGRFPPLRPQDWILAHTGDQLLGFVGVWDQRPLRQIRLLNPPAALRLLGWHPDLALPLGHCLHLCLKPTARRLLPGLLQQALRQARSRGLGLLGLALDAQDPLCECLPASLRLLGSSGRMHLCSTQPPRRPRPYHLEISLG
ncbi:MAG TPA: GNAT family N-acetyltransferase [Candidatus Obscuribacterales bacterium]